MLTLILLLKDRAYMEVVTTQSLGDCVAHSLRRSRMTWVEFAYIFIRYYPFIQEG